MAYGLRYTYRKICEMERETDIDGVPVPETGADIMTGSDLSYACFFHMADVRW